VAGRLRGRGVVVLGLSAVGARIREDSHESKGWPARSRKNGGRTIRGATFRGRLAGAREVGGGRRRDDTQCPSRRGN
jgi:hypothetical protein